MADGDEHNGADCGRVAEEKRQPYFAYDTLHIVVVLKVWCMGICYVYVMILLDVSPTRIVRL